MSGKKGPTKSPNTTRVLIVDDHPMVRERLSEIIQAEPGYVICGEADDCATALEAIASKNPAIAIVDLTLKNSSGFDLIKDIHDRWPELAVLVVSMHDESLHAERAIHAEARGYITKQEATRKILLALDTIRDGQIYLSEQAALKVAQRTAGRPRAKSGLAVDSLSNREFRVFELIGQGRSTLEIAAELQLDRHTIETYRARIKQKLNLRSSNELLQHAISWGQFGRPG